MEGTASEEGVWWPGRLVAHPAGGQRSAGPGLRGAGSGPMCLGPTTACSHFWFALHSLGGSGWGQMVGEWEEGSKIPITQPPLCSGVDGLTSVSDSKSLESSLHSLS